jgi:mycofactocin glycosyltransferase
LRPSVDVVVPFHGSARALAELFDRLAGLALQPDDTVTIVDNTRTRGPRAAAPAPLRILRAPERQSSYYARNRGAAAGRQPWLVFIDADVTPRADLLDRYLAVEPDPRTAVLAGAVREVRPATGRRESLAGRYAQARRITDQANTLQQARPYAKTANCAVRREAFEHVSGFVDDIRSGGDADLCFRLADAGWALETRGDAVVDHHARRRLVDLLGQRARHGSGAEWLSARYPGFIGPRRPAAEVARGFLGGTRDALHALWRGDRERALTCMLEPINNAAFQVGRRVPNATWREQPILRRLVPRRRAAARSRA